MLNSIVFASPIGRHFTSSLACVRRVLKKCMHDAKEYSKDTPMRVAGKVQSDAWDFTGRRG